MKLLLVLENHFYIDDNQDAYCDRVIDYNFLNRYLKTFDEVIVCGRTDKNNDGKYKLKVTGENVKFKPLPNFYGIKGILLNICKLRKILRQYIKEADAVLYRVPTPLSIFTYDIVKKENKVLAVEFMISADKMIEGKNILSKLGNKIIDKIAKKICMTANGVSYVTERVLQEKYPCKAIINRSETDEYFTASYSTIELDEKYIEQRNWDKNNKPKEFTIIHTGFMDTYRKGQHILIKATKKVIQDGFNVKLILIGDGVKKKEFEELAKNEGITDKVYFTGNINDKNEIYRYLQNSHLMVFPTQAEGLPRTLIEAMATGLPCISSPVDGIPELIDQDLLIDYEDYIGYSKKIEELLSDWNKMIKIGRENCKKAEKYEKKLLDSKRQEFYNKIRRLCNKRR